MAAHFPHFECVTAPLGLLECVVSGPQFARVAGINYQTFATWRQQHKRQACETKDSGNLDTGMVGFVEAVMQGPQDASSARSVTLSFCPAKGMPLEFELELSYRDQLSLVVALIKALQQPCWVLLAV